MLEQNSCWGGGGAEPDIDEVSNDGGPEACPRVDFLRPHPFDPWKTPLVWRTRDIKEKQITANGRLSKETLEIGLKNNLEVDWFLVVRNTNVV